MGWGGIEAYCDGDSIGVGETDFSVDSSEYRALLDDYADTEEEVAEWVVAYLATFLDDRESRYEVDYLRHESKEAATASARQFFERQCGFFNRLSAEKKAELASQHEEKSAVALAGGYGLSEAKANRQAADLRALFERNAALWTGARRLAVLRSCARAAARHPATSTLLRAVVDLGLPLGGADEAFERSLLEVALGERGGDTVQFESVRFLFERGVPVDGYAVNKRAAYSEPLLRLLLEVRGAPPPPQLTQMLYYAVKGNPHTLALLLQHGADANGGDVCPLPPLIVAVRSPSVDCVRVLLEAGADTEAVDPTPPGKRRTALLAAVEAGSAAGASSPDKRAQIVQLLLQRGARRDAVDEDGKTAQQLCKHADIAQLLAEPLMPAPSA
jgi:hypothetical protein